MAVQLTGQRLTTIDANGNKFINVEAGTADSDGVNYGQIKNLGAIPTASSIPTAAGDLGELIQLDTTDGEYRIGLYVRIANNAAKADFTLVGEQIEGAEFPTTNRWDGRAFYLEAHHTAGTVDYTPGWYIWRTAGVTDGWYVTGESIEALRLFPDPTITHTEPFEITAGIWTANDIAYIYEGLPHDVDNVADLVTNYPYDPADVTTLRSGWSTLEHYLPEALPHLHFGGIWTNAGTTAEPNYISDTVDIVGILSDQHSSHNFATEADWQADTDTDFERGQYVTVTAEADKIWKVLTTTVGYGAAGNYQELAIDDEDTENLILATASDLDRALGRFPTTEAWQNNRFLTGDNGIRKETTFPTDPALGDEFFLDVSVSVTDGTNRRARGFYTFLQPLPDPASHFWEQVTPAAIGQLYNNARVGDIVYLQYEETNFNTIGNNFQPGFYRASATAVAAPNHTTWTAVTTRTDVVAGTGVTVDTVDANGVITSTITSDTILNRADVTVPTVADQVLRTGRVESIATFVADASVALPADLTATPPRPNDGPAWVTVGPSALADPADGNISFLDTAGDVTNVWAEVTHIRVVEADADAHAVLDTAMARDDLFIGYNVIAPNAVNTEHWALLTVGPGTSTTTGGFTTLPVTAVAGENDGIIRAETGRIFYSVADTGFNTRNVLRYINNDGTLTHIGVFDLEQTGIVTTVTPNDVNGNTNTVIGTTGTDNATATLHNQPVNSMAYLSLQFNAVFGGIRITGGTNPIAGYNTSMTDAGAVVADHTYIEYTSVWNSNSVNTTFVDRVDADGLTETRRFTAPFPAAFDAGIEVNQI